MCGNWLANCVYHSLSHVASANVYLLSVTGLKVPGSMLEEACCHALHPQWLACL